MRGWVFKRHTYGNLSISLLGEANDAGVLSTNFGKLDFSDITEFVTQCLPCPGDWHL